VRIAKQLADALRADLASKVEMVTALENLPEETAIAALETFENPLGAVSWLTSPAMALEGRIPMQVLQTKDGNAAVLRVLARIDRNLM
jgi:uncharacterized protein (DUF2384 family)